jgi:hypothetical protein
MTDAFHKPYLADYLMVPMLTKFGSKTAKDTQVHSMLAKDLMQQAPWKYRPGERFETLKRREAEKIETALNEEALTRIGAAADRRVVMYGAMLRKREYQEMEQMERSEQEMRMLMAKEAAIKAKQDTIRKRRGPALKRLEQLKVLDAERGREALRERLARDEERRLVEAEIEAVRVKEEKFRKQIADLAAFSPYTAEVKDKKPKWSKGNRPSIDFGMFHNKPFG